MLKKYYIDHDEIKVFVDTFHRKANKLLTAHTRKKLAKIMAQLIETPFVSSQHELLCCSSPGLTADIQVTGLDSEGVIHVSLTNRRGKEGERHTIHYDCYRVPFRYVRPHSYTYIANDLAESLFPDGLPEDRKDMWNMQIANVLYQHCGVTDPTSRGEHIDDKYLAFDYQYPLLKVTAAINDSIILKEFCLDDVSHVVNTRATLGCYLALKEHLTAIDALCQEEDANPVRPASRHLTRQANRLIDLTRVLRRLTHRRESDLREYLVTLLEETSVRFDTNQLEVMPETTPTLKLTTSDGEWYIALSVNVILELTGPEPSADIGQETSREIPEVVSPLPESVEKPVDFASEQNQSLNQLVKNTLTQSGVFLDKEGGVDAAQLYQVLEKSLQETGPILGWFRQKGIYVKYRVKQKPHPVLPTIMIKVDIIKEQPVKRNLVNIDIDVSRDDMDELGYIWKMLWMSLVMQADCP